MVSQPLQEVVWPSVSAGVCVYVDSTLHGLPLGPTLYASAYLVTLGAVQWPLACQRPGRGSPSTLCEGTMANGGTAQLGPQRNLHWVALNH